MCGFCDVTTETKTSFGLVNLESQKRAYSFLAFFLDHITKMSYLTFMMMIIHVLILISLSKM